MYFTCEYASSQNGEQENPYWRKTVVHNLLLSPHFCKAPTDMFGPYLKVRWLRICLSCTNSNIIIEKSYLIDVKYFVQSYLEMIHFDEHMLQMGWNHQLVNYYFNHTPWKINMEPTNHACAKENHFPILHHSVQDLNFPGCRYLDVLDDHGNGW